MPSRRDALLIIAAAVVLALLAWVLLTSGSSDAPESEPGAGVVMLTRLLTETNIGPCRFPIANSAPSFMT